MVKRIFLVLENNKYEKLLQIKGDKTWEKLLIDDLLERSEVKIEASVKKHGKT